MRGDLVQSQTRNSVVWSETGRLVALVGLENIAVVDTADALLVVNRGDAQEVVISSSSSRPCAGPGSERADPVEDEGDEGPVRPVKVQPRLDPKPWGGRLLEAWGIRLPPSETIGEALLTAPEATVATGALSGTPLSTLASTDPAAWIGARGLEATGGRPIFPLLVKLIDGQADLSIQIHPNDRAAAAAGLGTGKTEAYHVLAAAPGASSISGSIPG